MSNARPIRCNQTNRIGTAELITYCLDLSDLLQADELIDTIVSVTADDPLLGITDKTILAADTIIDGAERLTDKCITFQLDPSGMATPPAAGTAVELTAIVTTDAGNTRAAVCPLIVQD
jgi:hypothetical protein